MTQSQHNPRVLIFATSGRKIVLLHGFTKIGRPHNKIPESEIQTALKRMQDHEERHGSS